MADFSLANPPVFTVLPFFMLLSSSIWECISCVKITDTVSFSAADTVSADTVMTAAAVIIITITAAALRIMPQI